MVKLFRSLLMTVCSLLGINWAHAADIYKWVDETGEIHYTQSPPQSGKNAVIQVPTSPSMPPAALPPSATEKSTEAINEQVAKERQALEAAQKKLAEQMKANCETAKSNATALSSLGSRRFRQSDGTAVRLDDEQRNAKLKEIEEQINVFCTEPAKK